MKTKLLLTFVLLLAAQFITAQSIVLSHEGEDLENGAEITVQGSVADPEIVVELAVTNIGSSSVEVLCQRYEMEMVAGTMSAICWGGLCYPPTTSLSPLSTTIGPGVTVDNDFSGHYYSQGNEGISTIAFTFFDEANPSDSAMVVVMFEGLTVGVNELSGSDLIEVYPNPANEYVSIDLNRNELNGEVSVKLVNTSGAVVMETKTTGSSLRINTSELAEGIYMYQAFSNSELIAADKVIIKH